MKSFHRWTNRSFDDLLGLLRELIPNGKQNLPKSYSSARKYVSGLGLHYEKYDVCHNHCTLYWGSFANATSCQICGLSRWKSDEGKSKRKKTPYKVLRYFPLKPRLQKLFMSSQVASDMRWHKEKRINDGIMRHPADSLAWKSFDEQHGSFASDARNVRLGLATDGFQPFGNMSSQHSIWPVILIPYNLPPWICMKQTNLIISMIIPGEHSPGMGIDIFLQPLIAELKELWEVGVETYDAHSKKNFTLHASIIWTISDFPAYGDLSGWSTKGYKACPACHKYTSAKHLACSKKMCYMDHRRFLPPSHKWRKDTKSCNGFREIRAIPKPLSGDEVLMELETFTQMPFNRGIKRKYDASNSFENWRKKSIFFQLPYWKTLLIRHNLDVMHIEKNVCDNVLETIMNIKGKTKDNLNSRYDLVSMGIRHELHPIVNGNNVCVPMAQYVLSNHEKEVLCKMLANLKTPDGYLSKISRCVNVKERKISGMKSHDCHVFIQRLLPLAIRGFLPKNITKPLIQLSAFFRDICSKSLDSSQLDDIEKQIVLTLCKLEMIFPPSFFDIMVHLVVHLPGEAKIAGPVQYRWMYPIERYLHKLKLYVRNKAKPEGSIAEAYIADECLTFCSRYLVGIDTIFNQLPRNDDGFDQNGCNDGLGIVRRSERPLGRGEYHLLTDDWKQKAHLYILNNCEEVWPYVEKHKGSLPNMSHRELMRRYNSEFPNWFFNHVVELHAQGAISDDLLHLAEGPLTCYKCYTGYIVNEFHFHTLDRQKIRQSQNFGVMSRGDNNCPNKEYYGTLMDVWELQYSARNQISLFKCEWFDVRYKQTGYIVDNYSITSVKANARLSTEEPFILACQAEQVFYVEDPKNPNWLVVMKTHPRDLYNMPIELQDDVCEIADDNEVYQEEENDMHGRPTRPLDNDDDIVDLNRVDVDPEEVPIQTAQEIQERIEQDDEEHNQELNIDVSEDEFGDDNNEFEEEEDDD
ncbi:uncharacterized protein LOC131171152 [Hevea brasiliensis]|uniref:uncharacterized protein LOC131171152 n=1 Tax=Hevea brasiliensis TaxID=3981 RepID=UPI0025E318B9|nr:uncharacterized protein LOC131171152 [Hevea brasiliensis]